MSGHSKWANIKTRKGAQDKKRSVEFTKMAKLIMTAVRQSGGNTNIESNSLLKSSIEKAKEVNMPKENIERLLTRFNDRKNNLVNFYLEGFMVDSVPAMVEIETDNKNRTLSEVKLTFRDNDALVGDAGSVAFMFDKKGEIELENEINEDIQLDLIDAGAQDIHIWCEVEDLSKLNKKIEEIGGKVVSSQIVMKCKNPVVLEDEEKVSKILDFVDLLEENDDVVNVFTGFDYVQKS